MKAPADELRALPAPLARAVLARVEREQGAEVLAALRYDPRWWARPEQALPSADATWTIAVIVGEYGTGKTWTAVQLFLREILEGRAKRPRIICATGPAIEGTIIEGPSGIRAWLPPEIRCEFRSSKGHEGVLWIGDVKVACLSADAPGQAIGEGSDLDLRDDVAKWVVSAGATAAEAAWAAASKSCREGYGRAIVPTTPDGAEFISALLQPGQRRGVHVIDLGAVENNRGNLAASFVEHTVKDLRDANLWAAMATTSPFAMIDFRRLRRAACPPLVELAVAIDPSLSAHGRSCEVGIVGGGRDARSAVHVRRDVSAVLDAGVNGWPAVAWDLAEELQLEHPGVPWHFVLEINVGRRVQELLRGEERIRRLRAKKPEVSTCEIRLIKADKNKCKRAESPARLASQEQVFFAPGLNLVEAQLRALTPEGTKSDRADATVHLVNDQAGLSEAAEADTSEATRESFVGLVEAQRRQPRPAFGGQRV